MPGALVALRPLEQLVEAVGGVVDGRVQVAPIGEPRGNVLLLNLALEATN